MVVDRRQRALKYFLAWKGAQMVFHLRPPQKPPFCQIIHHLTSLEVQSHNLPFEIQSMSVKGEMIKGRQEG